MLEDDNTTRDRKRLVLRGLLHGIAAIQNHRSLEQEIPTMRALCAVVRTDYEAHDIRNQLWLAEQTVGHEIDLWPDHEAMTDEDVRERDNLRRLVTHRSKQSAFRPVTRLHNAIVPVDYSYQGQEG